MNTLQLSDILKSDQAVSQIFLGVFSIDKLPPIYYKPAALVVNLDKSSEPGSHWVCMYFYSKEKCDFFDSYGRKPSKKLLKYIFQHARIIQYNGKCIQSFFTSTCGQLCVYFLVWRVRGPNIKAIVQSLDQDYADEFVTGFINGLFKANTQVVDQEFQNGAILRNTT